MARDEFEENNLHAKRKSNEEVLEISSTGYGLESVSKTTAEKEKFKNQEDENSSSGCGGL